VAFPSKLLQEGEDLILDLTPHWWYLVPAGSLLAVAIVLGLLSLAVSNAVLSIVAGLVVLAALAYFGWVFMKWHATNFVVTSERLIFRQGFITKHGTQMPLDKINTVDFHQGLFERVIGAGDLLIESGSDTGVQRFTDIRKPVDVQHEIIRQMDLHDERERSVVLAPGSQGTGLSVAEQLEKLAVLQGQGHLSREEFEAEKARLLGQQQPRPPAPPPLG
jgi:uncharacterized membrane protein YdbT with pleckstrin-like domain